MAVDPKPPRKVGRPSIHAENIKEPTQGYVTIAPYGDLRCLILEGPRMMTTDGDKGHKERLCTIKFPETGAWMHTPAEGVRVQKWEEEDDWE